MNDFVKLKRINDSFIYDLDQSKSLSASRQKVKSSIDQKPSKQGDKAYKSINDPEIFFLPPIQ